MSRNRKSAKTEGTRFETVVRDYLAQALDDDRIMRPRLHGATDIGDIANTYFMGQRVCIECKNTKAKAYRAHMLEAIDEAGNLDAPFYFVVQKVPGIGFRSMRKIGSQMAYTTPEVLDAMRREAPDDLFLHNTGNFTPFTTKGKAPMELVRCDLRSLAVVLNHGLPLGREMES
ncbi:hypothetical protein [Bifidobacterium mongoliense]|uniref:Gp86 n=1 Tax=Bifidobacterium mongoliense DSM 21395 TaxID=1437603 RepID=A0A087CAI6_9BIFI|nr:hypothetical protein [Bifidobacterium mongoliense]KFI80286.1 gp86 [Bifidobacterium mongoliense DSM 21395]